MIRWYLRRRGYLVVPMPPDPDSLRDAGRAARRTTREWINDVADAARKATR